VALDAFVVMPNHVHGLIHIVQAIDGCHTTTNQFGPLQKGALPAIVQSYKAAVTRQCRRQGHDQFKWQSRYYEHIVRRDGSLHRIRQYIVDNPRKWAGDRDNATDLWM
jgi:putative transposase